MNRGPKIPRITGKLDKVFAKNIKTLRGDLSQVQFSKKLQIAQSTLNRIENGQASPTLYMVEAISKALKINPLDLLKSK